jgi:Family of unknown function (DUF5832)
MSKQSTDTVVEDFLDEDSEIPGQRFVLLSFISPETVLANKDRYFFEQFLRSYEIDWKVKNLEKFLADRVIQINRDLEEHAKTLEKEEQTKAAEICRKNRMNVEDVLSEYHEFVRKQQRDITRTSIEDAWGDFIFKERSRLEDDFHSKNDFRTSVRGLKVRGVASSMKEAEVRAKKLQGKDKYHNILVGEVGKWLAWDPSPNQVAEQEYAESELNTLMKKYKENEDSKEKFFEERKLKPAPKKVFGAMGGEETSGANTVEGGSATADSNGSFAGLFNSPEGDLALARKMQQQQTKPSITLEKVEGDATNDVVEPVAEKQE